MIEVWNLTVDSPDSGSIITQVFATEQECYDVLREGYDPEGEHAALENGDMMQALIDHQGLVIYVDSHKVDLAPWLFTGLDLSTGHLPQSEFDTLDVSPPRTIEHEFGMWVNVTPLHDDDDDEDYWEDFPYLRHVLTWAQERGARWINFDRDGEHVPDLPTWEW